MDSTKQPTIKRPPKVLRPATLKNGVVTVSVTRKHSVRQYETLDVQLTVAADVESDESQHEATMRLYQQAKIDIQKMSLEMLELAKKKEI